MKVTGNQKPYSLDLSQTVDLILKRPAFGIESYSPENRPDHLVSPRMFKQQKYKRETFVVSVPKLTARNPAVGKYDTCYDWKTMRPDFNQKMAKAKVNSFVDQIFHKSKSPEKSSPSPTAYKNLESWRHTDKGRRVPGTIKFHEARTTFVVEKEDQANLTPGFKYNAPPLVSSLFD